MFFDTYSPQGTDITGLLKQIKTGENRYVDMNSLRNVCKLEIANGKGLEEYFGKTGVVYSYLEREKSNSPFIAAHFENSSGEGRMLEGQLYVDSERNLGIYLPSLRKVVTLQ